MKAALTIWLIAASIFAACANPIAGPEIALAIRYLKAQGITTLSSFYFDRTGVFFVN
jgi:hypothetical protein